MGKRIAMLAVAGVTLAGAGALLLQQGPEKPVHQRSGKGRPPVEGDYWAVRLAYGGDPQHMRFEPRWLIEAARGGRASGWHAGCRCSWPARRGGRVACA